MSLNMNYAVLKDAVIIAESIYIDGVEVTEGFAVKHQTFENVTIYAYRISMSVLEFSDLQSFIKITSS